jgi:hypothetical protein
MRLRWFVLVVTAALVLGACGGDDDDSASNAAKPTTTVTDAGTEPATDDADLGCPLLKTEVELNLSVDVSSVEGMEDGSGCLYMVAPKDIIRIGVSEDGQTERENFNEAVTDGEPVELLGRDAVWSASTNTLDILDDDGAGIQIGIGVNEGSTITDPKQAALDLAGVVLAGR